MSKNTSDTKKLFELEYELENHKPEFTAEETVKAMSQLAGDANVISYSIMSGGSEGIYLKFSCTDGNHTKMIYINPVVAKALANGLLQNLSAQGFYQGDLPEDDISPDYPHTIH